MKRTSLICLFALLFVQTAFPWGHVGHSTVADIAESRLTPEAAKQIHEILAVEHFEHLHDVSSWADQIKEQHLPGSPAHSQRQPLDHSTTVVINACPSGYCAVAGIHDYYKVLADKSAPIEKREVALKYLVHLVGDLHQPLHGAADTGKEKVIFLGKENSLHGIWDTGILYTRGRNPEKFAKQFEADAKKTKLNVGGTPEDWALESRDIVRDQILPQLPKPPAPKQPIALPDDYADKNWNTVQTRITQAGYRLADLINSALK